MRKNKNSIRGGVSVITCTNRPRFFNNIIANYKTQLFRVKELVIVINKDSMSLAKYRKKVRGYKNISVFKVPERVSLGRCLNYAVSKTKYQFIAKFDDDDYYSPHYLKQQMNDLHRTGADIVGKRAFMIYLQSRKQLILRFPRQHNRFVRALAGGTLLFRKRVCSRVRFANISLGEDGKFIRACLARGYKLYASAPRNYIAVRRTNKKSHTWKASDSYVKSGSRILAKSIHLRKLASRKLI
ncbi:glycosyltransferase family 2 protein [Brevibacillus brevis]|uniref:glycosyltransferase family 2 protein n=1 Tax=Brevibacillus brevis TaxID=1393 RepID=UPI00115A8CE3|nr:glycosyltransferase family A protein [Lysinibacillus sp. SDF0063]TQR38594.1 glycosyltransferase family 2 protein [Lysinibacillus sp. SDF0063]